MKTEPIEARCHIMTRSFGNGYGDEIMVREDAEEAVRIAYKEGQSSPKIKQLEWEFYYGTFYSAKTAFVDYIIMQENDFTENDSNCELWVNGFPSLHSTLEEAKAAAQADFEKRVLECLDVKAQQKQALIDMMRGGEELGLYDD